MKTHINGTISELYAQSYFVENGYVVSKPINDFNEYDLVIDNGILNKVQIKTIYFDNSKKRYLVSLVTSHIRGNDIRRNKVYTKDSFDLLCCVNKELNSIYVIPFEEIKNTRSITIYPTKNIGRFEKYRVK